MHVELLILRCKTALQFLVSLIWFVSLIPGFIVFGLFLIFFADEMIVTNIKNQPDF